MPKAKADVGVADAGTSVVKAIPSPVLTPPSVTDAQEVSTASVNISKPVIIPAQKQPTGPEAKPNSVKLIPSLTSSAPSRALHLGTASIITSSENADAIEEGTALTMPIDISDQYTEIIAGVPIIESPQHCGQGGLEIDVIVENIGKPTGTIVADLHDDVQENFLVWDKVVLRVRTPAQKGEVSFCIPLTKPGDYAIAIYHDKNSNKEFDKNFLGIPKERFGMSNNPKFGTRSPKYKEAAFTVPESGTSLRIKLRRARDILGGQK